jgi:hypothetical protein
MSNKTTIKNPTRDDWHQFRNAVPQRITVTPSMPPPPDTAGVHNTLAAIRKMVKEHDIDYEVVLEEFLLLQQARVVAAHWDQVLPYCIQRKYKTGEYDES